MTGPVALSAQTLPATPDGVAGTRLRQERDLYRRLLCLGAQAEIEPFLEEALALIVDFTGARRGYLELGGRSADGGRPDWWTAHDCSTDDLAEIRSAISRGIIAEALATGDTVTTASAMLDPRFRELGSVQIRKIEAVLCAPLGGDASLGVIYLQGHAGAGPFGKPAQEGAELFARHVAKYAEHLLVRRRSAERLDATRDVREKLRSDRVIGRSPALAALLRQAALVAPLDVHVLLTGESGTGKSQLARVIHENGPRSGSPLVELNCAALPEGLIENELFGAVAGAHSTADRAIAGKVAAAEQGTLFLDEIGELPLSSQAKLLHLLQSGRYHPLGSAESVQADVRVIAATNVDLEEAVRQRRFREDLFYRLQVLPVRLPSLGERNEDVVELAQYFCADASERHGLRKLALSPGAQRAVAAAEWPGNVRQLAHAIEAAVIRAAGEGAQMLEHQHVFPNTETAMNTAQTSQTFQEATRHFQRDLLQRTLEETGWNVTEAARRLDLARSHVYNLIRAFGFQRARGASVAES